jgi:hypothetical protein
LRKESNLDISHGRTEEMQLFAGIDGGKDEVKYKFMRESTSTQINA